MKNSERYFLFYIILYYSIPHRVCMLFLFWKFAVLFLLYNNPFFFVRLVKHVANGWGCINCHETCKQQNDILQKILTLQTSTSFIYHGVVGIKHAFYLFYTYGCIEINFYS